MHQNMYQSKTLFESQILYSFIPISEYHNILEENKNLKLLLQEAYHKIANLEEEIAKLKETITLMQHQIFGKKSEVNIGEKINSEEEENKEDQQLQTVSGYTRKKGKKSGRIIDTKGLLRHQIYHDLSEEEKICQCCKKSLEQIGTDVSEQIEVIPAKLYVVEHIRYKYCCRNCNTVVMASKPMAPIPKSLAGASLITDLIINKYQYHLPLYRQSKMLESYNAQIPDNTLGNLVMQSGEELMAVYDTYWKIITSCDYLQVDETPVKVLKPDKKGYLWTYFAPLAGKGLVVYEMALTREGEVAEKRLANFKGLLQTDGYAGYNELRKREDLTNLGCMSHVRRKFDTVLKITKNKVGIAAEVINRLKPIYALEAKMHDLKFGFHTRKRMRQKYAKPLLKDLRSWLMQVKVKVPPKSKLMDAIKYFLNQWPFITAYLRHGKAEIDNNWIENENRPVALGRRNWLFMGNEDSGIINALWYTFVQSALINGINPRIYIHYLLTQTHAIRTKAIDVMTLLPHTIDHAVLQKFAEEQMAIAKQVFNSFIFSAKEMDFNFIKVFNEKITLPPKSSHDPPKQKLSFKQFSNKIKVFDSS